MLLTGATGFIGRRISDVLMKKSDFHLTCVVREPSKGPLGHEIKTNDLGTATDWSDTLLGQKVIIHAAARAHILRDEVTDPLEE